MNSKTVNSLSGGKSSSYMSIISPADVNLFSLVCIEAEYCKPKDQSIVKYVSDKINRNFIATAESDKTLYAMRDLEQAIGKEIVWVAGETFEQVIKKKKALPNIVWRFCTTEMKMRPIFDYCQNVIGDVVIMNIGIRLDEKERMNQHNTNMKVVIGKTPDGRNKWGEVYWRDLEYPLVKSGITRYDVTEWAKGSGIMFPADSNCVGCFWKPEYQLRKNWDDEPQKMRWFSEMEVMMKRTFKSKTTYEKIKKIGLQTDIEFGTGSGCQAGFCTD